MATGQLAPLLHYLRAMTTPGAAHELADAELLSRFCRLRDEAAFTTLVRRHGPMVFAVCRRVLHDAHTAEDAFQATFLVLARKAESLARPELLAPWLHGVAYRTAIKARTEAIRRRTHEQQAVLAQESAPDDDPIWRDVRAVLNDEVNRLPARYRVPVVLCYLQGQTNAEAARRLGCSRGTVATLLARARQKLRRRLTQRGLGLSVGIALAALVETARGGVVPRALEQVTVKAATLLAAGQTSALGALAAHAVALAKGVSKAMLMEKLKIPVAILMVTAVLGAGAGVTAYCVRAEEGGFAQAESEAKPPPADRAERVSPPVTAPSGETTDKKATYRTENFLVTAPTLAAAQQVARIAERNRKALALLWLGKELPTWAEPCPVRVIVADKTIDSHSTFQFRDGMMVVGITPIPAAVRIKPKVKRGGMVLEGPLDRILADLLPHEMTHTILAEWRGKALPRWADEGAATLSESAASRAHHERAMAKALRSGHLLPLRDLLPRYDYPKDITTFYAESYSLTHFLITAGGREKFLAFVTLGDDKSWEKAAKSIYNCESLDKLEQMWLGYARMSLAEQQSDTPVQEAPLASRQPTPQSVPAQGETNARHVFQGKLPVGPAPIQILTVLMEDGRLFVIRQIVSSQPVTAERTLPNGGTQRVTSYQMKYVPQLSYFNVDGVRVYDTKGREVEKKELRKRLKGEMLALASADGRPVDPLHLRVYKEDTLVFVLPLAQPAPAVPASPENEPPPAIAVPPAVPDAPQVAPPPPVAAPPGAVPLPKAARVGQIIIIGNERTRDEVILEQVPFFPGEILSYPDLRIAEKNLARLKGLKSNPKVTVIDPGGDGTYKDIQITIEEK